MDKKFLDCKLDDVNEEIRDINKAIQLAFRKNDYELAEHYINQRSELINIKNNIKKLNVGKSRSGSEGK